MSHNYSEIFFIPEFLREGVSYKDEIHPDRIVFGGDEADIRDVADIYLGCIRKVSGSVPKQFYLKPNEAEAVKLCSNAYLAMRIAFFNEVDCFAENLDMNSANIIKAISGDTRIGDYYNEPSFGYGGYCLPKDTEQLANLTGKNGFLLSAIEKSNSKRKEYVVNRLVTTYECIGIYRLQSKRGSDNMRNSVMHEIMGLLIKAGKRIYLYEPKISDPINGVNMVSSVDELNEKSDIIVANRMNEELRPYVNKVYTRDVLRLYK